MFMYLSDNLVLDCIAESILFVSALVAYLSSCCSFVTLLHRFIKSLQVGLSSQLICVIYSNDCSLDPFLGENVFILRYEAANILIITSTFLLE